MKKTTVYFRGMNTDLEPRLMSKGKYRDATNVRIGGAKGTLGALENVQGLKELCCDNLPEGKNTSIGSYGSDETTSVFVFFHNSEGKHSIVRYYPLDETCCVLLVCEDLNFKLDHYISHIEFIDKTYLIWSDGKVNLNQKKQGGENVTTVTGQEIRSLNVCLYENKTGPFCYNFWIEKYTEEQDWSSVRSTLIIGEREVTLRGNVYEAIANLNDDSIKVEDCDGCLKIESTEKLEVRSGIPNILQPTNFCEGCNIPLIQYPPLCSPKVKLSKEEGKQANHIRDRGPFQFMVQYEYCDGQRSVWGPQSASIGNFSGCISCDSNCIEVNFSAPELMISNKICKVHIAKRESNTGDWVKVKSLDRCELGISKQTWCFKNQEDGTVLGQQEVNLYASQVPHIVTGLAFADSKLVVSTPCEGYDAIENCPKLETSVTYEKDDCNSNTWTIRGRLYIWNVQRDFVQGQSSNMPIHQDDSTTTFNGTPFPAFGGFGANFLDQIIYEKDVATDYEQIVPEGGFVVYLAGCPYFAVTKQVNLSGLNETGDGVYDSEKGEDRNAITNAMKDGDVYSEFEIKGVPPGKYILRVASHWVSYGDKLGKGDIYDLSNGIAWQKTSTYTIAVAGQGRTDCNGGDVLGTEATIDLPAIDPTGGYIFDLRQEPGYGDTVIADLTYPYEIFGLVGGVFDLKRVNIQQGYLIDAQGSSDQEDLQQGNRIEGQYFKFFMWNFGYLDVLISLFTLGAFGGIFAFFNNIIGGIRRLFEDNEGYTDHNGFFWFTFTDINFVDNLIRVQFGEDKKWKRRRETLYRETSLSDLLYGQLGQKKSNLKGREGLQCNIVYGHRENCECRVVLKGKIEADDCGVVGLKLSHENNGRVTSTDSNGNYSITAYRTDLSCNTRTDDLLIAQGSGSCCLEIDDYCIENEINFDEDCGKEILLPTKTISIGDTENFKSLKEGGVYNIGIIYYDLCGRYSYVEAEAEICIPCKSESKEEGVPVITFDIQHDPPEWAAAYEVVITEELTTSRYVQFPVGDVMYAKSHTTEDEDGLELFAETSYNSGEDEVVVLDFSNIYLYNQLNLEEIAEKESNGDYFGFEVVRGDRIKGIYDENGNIVDSFDTRIIKVVGAKIIIENIREVPEIKPGWFFEIYSDRKQVSDKVFYSIGQCYRVIDGEHEVEVGTLQGGDTYYRTLSTPIGTLTEPLSNVSGFVASSFANDFVSTSNSWDRGRAFLESDIAVGRVCRDEVLRYSDNYNPNNNFNGLGIFDSGNQLFVERGNGPITAMKRVSDRLMVFQSSIVTPFYIRRQILTTQNDNTIAVADPDNFLNKGASLTRRWGTVNPESVTINGRYIYYWDAYNNQWVRHSEAGQVAISNYGLNYEFDKVGERTNIGDLVLSVYDKEYEELNVAHTGLKCVDQVYIFSDAEDGEREWIGKRTFRPETFARIGKNRTFTVMNGKFYELNEGEWNIFGGQFYPSKVKIVGMSDGKNTCKFESMKQEASDLWVVNKKGIEVEQIKDRENMFSRLKENQWRCYNENFTAEFLKNSQTANLPELQALFEGEELRGKFIYIELTSNHKKHVTLFNVDIYFTESIFNK